jgi:uncharacterized protein YukE
MTTIRMELETVRSAARQLDMQAAEVLSNADTLKRAAGALSVGWQGPNAEEFQQNLRGLIDRIAAQGQELESLALRVSHETDEWQAADSGAADAYREGGVPPGWSYSVADIFAKGSDALDFGAKAVVAGGIVAGTTYAGQAIFYGGRTIKDLAGVGGLTHIQVANLPKYMVKDGPFDAGSLSGRIAIVGAGLEFADRGIQDWSRYDRGSEKAAAIALDGAFVVGKAFVQHYAGYAVASAATAALVTVGAPVAVVGAAGLLAWWGGSYVAGRLADGAFDAVKEPLVKGVSGAIDGAGKAAGAVAEAVFVNPARNIASWFH